MLNFYFFHIGDDKDLPEMLVHSIKISNSDCKVYQISDYDSPEISKVDKCFRFEGNVSNIMKFRMESYSKINLEKDIPTIFLDTDMLVVKKLNEKKMFKNKNIVFCKREMHSDKYINLNYDDLNMIEFKNKKLGDVWPYLGCFFAIKNINPFIEMNKMYDLLDEKYKYWYGDQTILKQYVINDKKNITFVGENEYACLPEALFGPNGNNIRQKLNILHFKGKKFKKLMIKSYKHFIKSKV